MQLTDERAAIGKHVGGSEPVAINVLARRVIERTSQSRVALLPYKAPYERGSEELRRGIPDPSWLHALTGWAAPRALNKNIDDGGAYEGSQDRAPIAIAKTA